MTQTPSPKPELPKGCRGCLVTVAAVIALLVVAVNFLPPLNVGGCSIGANHIHGRVVDQDGKPVAHAKIVHGANQSLTGEGDSRSETESDAEGNFSIFHLFGWVFVKVSKSGYYYVSSTDKVRGSQATIPPDAAYRSSTVNPILFRLHKQGELEPLVKASKAVFLADDGTPQTINLNPKESNPAHQIYARVWSKAKERKKEERYFDWRVEISVPGGGLQGRSGDFNFTAPDTGYQETETISFSTSSPGLKSLKDRSYFVKLNDGTYARIEIRIHDIEKFFLDCDSWFNPKTDSRNLEVGAH